jgi:hypothetical protein
MFSGFRRKLDEIVAVQGSYAACSGNSTPTLRDNLSVQYSNVRNQKEDRTERWSRNFCKVFFLNKTNRRTNFKI